MHSRSRSQLRVKMLVFVQMISSKPPVILVPNSVSWCITVSRTACKKIDLLFSRSRSLHALIWSKHDNFYCIIWTADPFAIKLDLIVHYPKPECFMEKLECCVHGQSHRKMSKCVWLFRWYFLNCWTFLLPNLVWWCIIMSQIVVKKWFAVFKVKVTVKNKIIQLWLIYNLNCWSFCN